MWQYDPLTDTWTERTPFPGGDRYQLISFVINDKAYMAWVQIMMFLGEICMFMTLPLTHGRRTRFPRFRKSEGEQFCNCNKGFVVFGTDGGLKDELWEFDAVQNHGLQEHLFLAEDAVTVLRFQ